MILNINIVCILQYIEDGSKAFSTREPDYAGQYSPWSCDTIGSYIGSKDPKPKDGVKAGAVEIMVCRHLRSLTVSSVQFLYV